MSIYGFLIGVGTVIVLNHLLNRFNKIKPLDILLLLFSTLFFSRFLFCLHNIKEILDCETNPVALWDGGLTIYGALIGILISIYFISKRRKIPFLDLTDTIFLIIPLAQSIGRWGNYFNRELYGKQTSLPWGIYIDNQKYHPVFIYESILDLINFFILKGLLKFKKRGLITSIYLIDYGTIRLLMNILRIDKEYFLNLETSDIFSVICVILGINILIYISEKNMKDFLAKLFSRVITIALLVSAVLSMIYKIEIDRTLEILLFIFTLLLPMLIIILLKTFKITSDLNVTDRKERPKLLIPMGLSLGIATYIAYISKDPLLYSAYISIFSTFILGFFITLFWKISFHMIWTTLAVCVLIKVLNIPEAYYLLSILPLIAWSRLELKRHTLTQVIAGTILPFCVSIIVFSFF